jgi:gamma-glutamyltranspeptidase/glutathione hydrolase
LAQARFSNSKNGSDPFFLSIHGQDFWFGGADPRREGVAKGD